MDMANSWFQFKQFIIHQDKCAMKVTTDSCLFGAWVAEEINKQQPGIERILDIGTGTGILTLMITQQTDATIDAIEIDKEAFDQAVENVTASPRADRINILHGDAKTFAFTHKYDVIISNPPFYENELKGDDRKKNVARHGDDLSLFQLLTSIKNNLSVNGIFYLLLPFKRNAEIRKFLLENDLFILKIIFLRQSVNHDYFRMMISGKLKNNNTTGIIIDEIAIKGDLSAASNDHYTAAFKSLLKNYYLHL
jgi:tRNA1Val (adenine37-N6)-methyltransferase